jgi:septal ring-binding cell division protein DamX
MKTYKAIVRAQVNGNFKNIAVEVRANNSSDAKWILQAIYGFHAVLAAPVEEREVLTTETTGTQPATPEQQRITSLKTAKDRASDALKTERDRQKRLKATQDLKSLSTTDINS